MSEILKIADAALEASTFAGGEFDAHDHSWKMTFRKMADYIGFDRVSVVVQDYGQNFRVITNGPSAQKMRVFTPEEFSKVEAYVSQQVTNCLNLVHAFDGAEFQTGQDKLDAIDAEMAKLKATRDDVKSQLAAQVTKVSREFIK